MRHQFPVFMLYYTFANSRGCVTFTDPVLEDVSDGRQHGAEGLLQLQDALAQGLQDKAADVSWGDSAVLAHMVYDENGELHSFMPSLVCGCMGPLKNCVFHENLSLPHTIAKKWSEISQGIMVVLD